MAALPLIAWLEPEIPEIKKEIRGRLGKNISGNFRRNIALSKEFCEGKIPKKYASVCERTATYRTDLPLLRRTCGCRNIEDILEIFLEI